MKYRAYLLQIPKDAKPHFLLDDMKKATEEEKADEPESPYMELIKGDYVGAIVDRYNYEVACGMRLIDEYRAMAPLLKSHIGEDPCDSPMLELRIKGGSQYDKTASHNVYIELVRKKYWRALFQQPQFVKQLTSNLQTELYGMVDELADYDFTPYNIYTLAKQMSEQVIGGIEETIMELFDDWTRKWHYDEHSENVHYFNGWCTNDAFAVNKKVIIPLYAFSYYDGSFRNYEVESKIADIEKVFDFLDGGIHEGESAINAIRNAYSTRNIQCKYFKVTFYKKGTCHIVFTDEAVLHKFILFAARGKNWLPPCYGKKQYADMTKAEKAVIDSFEGEESYNNVMEHSDYYLENKSTQLMLGA